MVAVTHSTVPVESMTIPSRMAPTPSEPQQWSCPPVTATAPAASPRSAATSGAIAPSSVPEGTVADSRSASSPARASIPASQVRVRISWSMVREARL